MEIRRRVLLRYHRADDYRYVDERERKVDDQLLILNAVFYAEPPSRLRPFHTAHCGW